MRAYKGFSKDMKCRGFQFEEGKTYEEKTASLCESGFHACENPLDCMGYYAPNDSVYHSVELDCVSNEREGDSKICAKRITVADRITFADMIKVAIQFVREKTKSTTGYKAHAVTTGECAHAVTTGECAHAVTTGEWAHAATTGEWAHAATAGECAHAATTGYRAHAVTTGEWAHAATTGECAHAATAGEWAHAATTGEWAHAATTGECAHAVTAGECAHAATTGECAHAVTMGYRAHAVTTGKNSISAALGIKGKAKASIGSWIVCAEYDDDDCNLLYVLAAQVDGENIKPDTWYALKNGCIVEVEKDG